jgi:hypothetical protein
VLLQHRPHPEAGDDSDAIVEGNIDPPLDEDLERMTRSIRDRPVPEAPAARQTANKPYQ